MGLQKPGGAYITYPDCDSIPMEVIGVVQDFNVMGFEQEIQAAAFTIGNDACVFQSGGGIFVWSACVVLLVAAVTIAIHTLRATHANIADNLRDE